MTTATATTATTATPTIWQDILSFISKVENAVEIGIADAEAALSKVASLAPAIAADIEALAAFVEGTPILAGNPDVQAAVAEANVAMQGLNAFATSYTQATSDGSITLSQAINAVVSGAQSASAAQTAVAAAKSTSIAATTTAQAAPAAS